MFELYIANKNYSSWSLRPWVLMRQLDIPFREQLVPFEQADNWERFRAFSPNGKVPCLVSGQSTVWDSLAIVEYLAEHQETVWPRESIARAWARSSLLSHSLRANASNSRAARSGRRVAISL